MVLFLRSVLAVFAGLIAGMVLVAGAEYLGHATFPPPTGLDLSKPGAMAELMGRMPTGAFLVLILGWAAGTFGGSWIAARIAPRWKPGHGLIIGGFFFACTVATILMIPHPAWVVASALVAIPLAAILGARLASPRRDVAALA